jgi:hypothetical protein
VLMSRYSCMRQSAGKHTVHLHGECKCRWRTPNAQGTFSLL